MSGVSRARQTGRGPTPTPAIYFASDYGLDDEFVGVVHAVLHAATGGVPVIDIAHGIPPFDIRAGALLLARVVPHLGAGVVLAVVDPGAGTDRQGVAIEVAGPGHLFSPVAEGSTPRWLVGPDNGLLGWAADALGGAETACLLYAERRSGAPGTFDGRDVFAPIAARLWAGEPLSNLGPPVPVGELVRLSPLRIEIRPRSLESEITWVDKYGNAQLAAVERDAAAAGIHVGSMLNLWVSGRDGRRRYSARRVAAFADLGRDELGVLVDANDRLAVVRHVESAAADLGAAPGNVVRLALLD
jgi:S-adenosylmethionine hydrolase